MGMRRMAGVVVMAALATVCPGMNFNPPVQIATGKEGGGSGATGTGRISAEPVVNGGRLHAIWTTVNSDGKACLYYRAEREPRSSYFSAPLLVNTAPTGYIGDYDLYADRLGRAHMVWQQAGGIWYASVQDNHILECGVIPNASGRHPVIRAFPWAAGQISTPMVALADIGAPMIWYRPLFGSWLGLAPEYPRNINDPIPIPPKDAVYEDGVFDATAGPNNTGLVRGAFMLRYKPIDKDEHFYRAAVFYRMPGAQPQFFMSWANSDPFPAPGQEQIAVQNVADGSDGIVVHFAFTENSTSKSYQGQYSVIPSWPGSFAFRQFQGGSYATSLAIPPNTTPADRFDQPLALAQISSIGAVVAVSGGGLAPQFALQDAAAHDIVPFSSPNRIANATITTAGPPQVVYASFAGQRKLRVIMRISDGRLMLFNEEGLPVVSEVPTPTATSIPAGTITPSPTPVFGGWVAVMDSLISKGRTPNTSEFDQGDGNRDGLWDAADVVRLRGGGQ